MIDRTAQSAQRALADALPCEASGCPDADTLIAFADGHLPEGQREAIAAKVAACARCAAAVRVALEASAWADGLAVDLVQATNSGKVKDLRARVRPRRRAWIPVALAASLALFVGAGLLLRQAPVEEPLRGAAAVATTPEDGARLPRAPERLAWPCDAAAGATQVELLAADATLIWSGPVNECAVILPAQTRGALTAGEYLWRVKNAANKSLLGPVVFRIEQ